MHFQSVSTGGLLLFYVRLSSEQTAFNATITIIICIGIIYNFAQYIMLETPANGKKSKLGCRSVFYTIITIIIVIIVVRSPPRLRRIAKRVKTNPSVSEWARESSGFHTAPPSTWLVRYKSTSELPRWRIEKIHKCLGTMKRRCRCRKWKFDEKKNE